jgi:hypothetical protein
MSAQKESIRTRDLIIESVLSSIEGKLGEKIDVVKLRRDQMFMYALLGDPAMKMRLPEKLNGTIKRQEDGWRAGRFTSQKMPQSYTWASVREDRTCRQSQVIRKEIRLARILRRLMEPWSLDLYPVRRLAKTGKVW